MMEKTIRVLWVRPNEEPQVLWIENSLSAKQDLVGGYIECHKPLTWDWGETAVIICNEEGKLIGLEPNRPLYDHMGRIYDVICGDFIILDAPEDSDDFGSLSDEQIERYRCI